VGVPLVGGSGGVQSSQAGGSAASALGQNVFLKLLVAQLQYQDPMQPMDSTTFVTQLAAFQTVEELQSIQSDLDQLLQLQQAKAATQGQPQPQGQGQP
jgi:flagellar basal-body rod modification protein FlgD